MVKLIAQIVIVLALSAGTLWLIPLGYYVTIAAAVSSIVLTLLLLRGRWADNDEIQEHDLEGHELSLHALEFFWRLVLAVLLGCFWPSLPVIIGTGRARETKADLIRYERR